MWLTHPAAMTQYKIIFKNEYLKKKKKKKKKKKMYSIWMICILKWN